MGKLIFIQREHEHQCQRCPNRWECEFGQFCDGTNMDELCLECAHKDIQRMVDDASRSG